MKNDEINFEVTKIFPFFCCKIWAPTLLLFSAVRSGGASCFSAN